MMEMPHYSCMTTEELEIQYTNILAQYKNCQEQKLNLNMARGKPAKAQLDLVSDILTVLQTADDCYDGSIDASAQKRSRCSCRLRLHLSARHNQKGYGRYEASRKFAISLCKTWGDFVWRL